MGTKRIEAPLSCRRESFNENCLRSVRDEVKERRKSETAEEAGSPFVSMPTIPAVYLAGDQSNQPLEKVSSELLIHSSQLLIHNSQFLIHNSQLSNNS